MATKTIVTRIKNKADTYQNWLNSSSTLLNGEVAIVRVPTGQSYTNPVTGKAEPVVELLMKVGDGSTAFSSLPWLSAKASDVYNWAKTDKLENVTVTAAGESGTLGAYLKQVDTNAAGISSLNGKVDVTKVSTAISSAISALKHSGTQGTNQIVKAVTQSNGNVAVTYGTITEAELPSISASKIKVDTSTTLDAKIGTMDAAIAANTNKLAGHTDDAINTLITSKINALDGGTDSGTSGSGKYVSKVTQTNGKVATTYTSFPSASTSAAGIVKLGATGGAATYDSIFGTDGISAKVSANETEIASLKTSIAGGFHFIGTVSAAPSSAAVTKSDGTTHTATAGDVVLFEGKEYIYTGSAWEELGDVTRIGALETKIAGLDVTTSNAVATTNKFVSQVKQTDGKIDVTYTQPTATNIAYGESSNVGTKLSEIDAAIASKADEQHDHPYASDSHTHGNIKNNGTITSTAVTSATGLLVYDSSNKIQRATAANVRTIIGAGTSNLAIGTTATTAAAGNHTHSGYETRIAALEGSTAIADALSDLDFSAPSASGNTVAFIDSVSQTDGKITATKKNIRTASTSQTGVVQLDDATNSTSTTKAATANAVKKTYDVASDAQTRVAAVEATYAKFNSTDNKLYIGADEIIFDCGGAE